MIPVLQRQALYHSLFCHFVPIVWFVKITQLYVYVLYFTDQQVKSVDVCKHKSDGQIWGA